MGEVASQKNHIAWTIVTHVVADDPLAVAGLDPYQLQLGVIVPVESIKRLDAPRATERMVSRLGDLLDSGSHGSRNDILGHLGRSRDAYQLRCGTRSIDLGRSDRRRDAPGGDRFSGHWH